MSGILFFLLILLAAWIARAWSKSRRLEDLIAKLTSRVFHLEEEVKLLRRAPVVERVSVAPRVEPVAVMMVEPAAVPVVERPVEEPPAVEPAPPAVTPVPPPSFVTQPSASPARLLSLEETLGTNWLNKLGIIILVIGVALFLMYEMREVGPAGKVTVGYTVALALLAAGIFFERHDTWRILSRAGIAGGWALIYFTTYAMYHVQAARVLSSEAVDLTLLLAVAAGLVLHTLRYESQMVTGLAFLLAFSTVNISRGNVYTLVAGAILTAGLAWVTVRRRWFEMELVGIAAVYLNHYLWLRPIIEPMHGHVQAFPEYAASAVLLYAYWLVFRASYLLRRVDDAGQERISTFAALLNPALFIAVSGYQSAHPELAFQFFLSMGAVEFIAGQLPIAKRRRAAFVVLTALGSCLLLAAFPYRYAGARLSASWLAEAEALLVAGVVLRESVFRRLGLIAALAAFVQMLGGDAGAVYGERLYGVRLDGQPRLALLFGFAAALFYFNAHWIPRRWPHVIDNAIDRLCFSRLYHLAATLVFVGAWIAWPHAWTAVAWAAFSALLAFTGRRLALPELSLDAAGCAAAAIVRVLAVNLRATQTLPHAPWMTERLVTVALVVGLLYLGARWAGVSGVLRLDRATPAYSWSASGLAVLLAWYELRPASVAPAWVALGLVLLAAGGRSRHLRWQSHAIMFAAFLRLFFVNLNAGAMNGQISARLYTTAPIALAFYYVYAVMTAAPQDAGRLERRFHIAECYGFLGTVALAALMRFELDLDLVVVAWAALALVLAALAWRWRRRVFLHQAELLALGVLARGVFHNLYERTYFPAPFGHGRVATLSLTVALLFAILPFAFSLRRIHDQPDEPEPPRLWARLARRADRRPEQIFFFIPFVLLTALLAVEIRSGLVTLAWGIEAVAVFLLALRAGERSYRLAGLTLLLLCVAKILFRDVWGLAPRDRYLTFLVLGSALLAVSFLYTRYRELVRKYL